MQTHKFLHPTHVPPTPFENFPLDTLNSEQKTSVKKRSTGPVRNRSTGRSTGDDFEIYRSGRVEKILTGSTSVEEPISASLLPGNIARFEIMSQLWRAVGETVLKLYGLRLEPQTFRFRDEHATVLLFIFCFLCSYPLARSKTIRNRKQMSETCTKTKTKL